MSESRLAAEGAARAGSAAGRVRRAWRVLPSERRLAAFAALGLFASLFLPWYQETVIPTSASGAKTPLPSASLTGWAAFSFVEAAVLLVAVGVLVLLFLRAEGRAFHVPGGDGGVITAAGLWTAVLVVWRMFDKQSTNGHGQYVTTSGIEWGIFIALGVAVVLAYAGTRIRLAHDPEPPLPGDSPEAGPVAARPRTRRRQAAQSRSRAEPEGRSRSRAEPEAQSRNRGREADPDRSDGWLPKPPRPRVMEEQVSWSYEEIRAASASPEARPTEPPPTEASPTEASPTEAPPTEASPTETPHDEAPSTQRSHAPHSDRSLNFSELHEIELDDPPEHPTVRRRTRIEDYDPTEAPTKADPDSDPDDQLTIRFDQD